MRRIDYIVLHTTAGPQNQKTQDIIRYWRNNLGWSRVGYHHLVNADGTVETLAPIESVTNGVKGHNANSIHIAYKGGVVRGKPTDNRTQAQKNAMEALVREYKQRFPNAKILGHRDFPNVAKACPCFDPITEYQGI